MEPKTSKVLEETEQKPADSGTVPSNASDAILVDSKSHTEKRDSSNQSGK